jgi:GNAT superfamily N-acetyltransferase
MKAMHRLATPGDATRLFELRRQSILALAPSGMPAAQAKAWAADLTVGGMERKISEMEIWIAELNGTAVGWGAIRGNRLEGLYTDPAFIGRGIGSELLGMLESVMRERGVPAVRAEASPNAEAFYLRRGYQAVGVRTPEGARPIMKRLG